MPFLNLLFTLHGHLLMKIYSFDFSNGWQMNFNTNMALIVKNSPKRDFQKIPKIKRKNPLKMLKNK